MPTPRGRGKVVKHRRKKLKGKKFLHCEVMQKAGPRGGKTVCHVKRGKGRN